MRHPHPPHHFQTSAIDRSRSCASSSLKTCHLQQSFFHEHGRHHYPSIHASSNSISDEAFATQQIADVTDGECRGLAILIPIIPASFSDGSRSLYSPIPQLDSHVLHLCLSRVVWVLRLGPFNDQVSDEK
ncbi:hypothetical protein GW17_00045620 [Ensete ventricosum]|nr:hypothetical protein GW17_00045620 [Ensete ventricosum]